MPALSANTCSSPLLIGRLQPMRAPWRDAIGGSYHSFSRHGGAARIALPSPAPRVPFPIYYSPSFLGNARPLLCQLPSFPFSPPTPRALPTLTSSLPSGTHALPGMLRHAAPPRQPLLCLTAPVAFWCARLLSASRHGAHMHTCRSTPRPVAHPLCPRAIFPPPFPDFRPPAQVGPPHHSSSSNTGISCFSPPR